ncbi:MAG TPA: hypothetical protein VHB79_19700 [Polyangiaceae bacterium]|nr:hypothetical protein [Polyangiaceae bacterium]
MNIRHLLLSGCFALCSAYPLAAAADTPAPAKSAAAKPAKTPAEVRKETLAKDGARNERDASVYEKLREELKAGKITLEEFKAKAAKLRESVQERKKFEREQNVRQWGELVERAEVRSEMQDHARRIAYLDQALVVAESETKEPQKTQLITRIANLRDKENARHQAELERFRAANARPGTSAAPASAPAPATSAQGNAK